MRELDLSGIMAGSLRQRLAESSVVVVLAESDWRRVADCEIAVKRLRNLGSECKDMVLALFNADDRPDFCADLGVQDVPTMIVFSRGREIMRASQLTSISAVELAIRQQADPVRTHPPAPRPTSAFT